MLKAQTVLIFFRKGHLEITFGTYLNLLLGTNLWTVYLYLTFGKIETLVIDL